MVRDQYAVDAVFHTKPRVFARINSLDEQSALPELAQAVDESPVHRRILPQHAGHIDAVIHGVLFDGRSGLAFVTGGALAPVFGPRAQISFAVAAGGVIAGESNDFAAGSFHAPQDFFAGVPGTRGIQLIPDGTPEFLIHVLDRGRS